MNEYIGDGLYADFDGWQIELYAYNGVNKTYVVYLEPDVLVTFLRYVENLKKNLTNGENSGTIENENGVSDTQKGTNNE